jgi:mono/diheme cytochrome c family protein
MPIRSTVATMKAAVFVAAAVAVACTLVRAQTPPPPPPAPAEPDEPVPTFAAEFLRDAKVIAAGQEVWQQQCRHCHGNSAYPGKAPKLSPGSLDPVYIFDRVTYGFKGMPSWRHVFTRDQRMSVVAYIKSDGFSP